MYTDTQHFSLELCQILSFFAPGFEGHYGYYKFYDGTIEIACDNEIWWGKKWLRVQQSERKVPELICPAWQAEDVLRNLKVILGNREYPPFIIKNQLINFICDLDVATAYQKIEEYLLEILGHSRIEECTSAHCKCMQNNCANHHYSDHKR